MITNNMIFNFANIPFLHFGAGEIKRLPELELFKKAKSVLVITGKSSFVKTKQFTWLKECLSGVKYGHEMVSKEPSPAMVDFVVNQYRNCAIDLVIGIGGGSVLDTAKAVSAMLTTEDSVKEYLEGVGTKVHDGSKIPMIAVPTTSGTGSEATKNAVLSEVGSKGYKKSLRHDNFVPDVALIDPELIVDCPVSVTAASGMDALTQLIGSYVSTNASPMTDGLVLTGIEMVGKSLLPLCNGKGNNVTMRSQMAYGAWISGVTLANAGLSTVHGYASSIGGMFDIPHGTLCGTLLAETVKKSIEQLKEESDQLYLKKYAKVGQILTDCKGDTLECCDVLVEYLENIVEILALPRLGEYGITVEDAEKIASQTSNKNNPVMLSKEQLKEIVINRI